MRRENPDLRRAWPAEDRQAVLRFFQSHGGPRPSLAWHEAYASVNGRKATGYIPEDLYYGTIEPALNPRDLVLAYSDKNMVPEWLEPSLRDWIVLKNQGGEYRDAEHRPLSREEAARILRDHPDEGWVLKPSLDSGGGRNVRVLETRPDLAFLERSHGRDFLLQRRVGQCTELGEVHPSSLNTLRILTLRLGGAAETTSAIARFGNGGSTVDNQAAGGVSCGIRSDAHLKAFAVDKKGRTHRTHPSTGKPFDGRPVPGFEAACTLVRGLHDRLPYFGIVSWDVAILPDHVPLLLELNLAGQEINFHQFNNGPLFGDRTEAVLRGATERRP